MTSERMSAADARDLLKPKKRSKYGAKRMCVDGIWFDSIAEAKFYGTLQQRRRAGEIGAIMHQPEFPLYAKDGGCVGKYRADFTFFDKAIGRERTVDVKGFDTPLSKWKRKHVKEQYGIDVELVR